MIVVDASVLATALVYTGERGRRARMILARDPEWAAPEHWKADVWSVLRGLTLEGEISAALGERAVGRLPRLGVDPVSLDHLLPRMWQIQASVSGCDAAYLALAEARDLTLVTANPRLAEAATSYCRIEPA